MKTLSESMETAMLSKHLLETPMGQVHLDNYPCSGLRPFITHPLMVSKGIQDIQGSPKRVIQSSCCVTLDDPMQAWV